MNKKPFTFKIRTKFIIVTILIFFVIFSITSSFWYLSFSKQAKKSSTENMQTVINASNNIFDAYLKDIYNMMTLISIDSGNKVNTNILSLLSNPNLSDVELVEYRKTSRDYLISLCSFKKYLYGVTISDFEGNSINYGVHLPFSDLVEMPWYNQIQSMGKDSILFIKPHTSNVRDTTGNSHVISIARPVFSHSKVIGFVLADIKMDIFNDFFSISPDTNISLTIYNNETREIIYDDGNNDYLKVINHNIYNYPDNDHLFSVSTQSDFTGWTTVGSISTNVLLSGFYSSLKQAALITLILWICSVLIIFYITILLTRNIERLTKAVMNINQDNLNIDVNITSNDEVKELHTQFTFMLQRIKSLIKKIQFTEKQKRSYEMKALQSQINPHFLHNTLNTIKFLANLQGAKNISKTAEDLSSILRINMDFRTMITLKEEKEYLEHYVSIQSYRYTNNFQSQILCDESLYDYLIPKLLIQPILENALVHGISNKNEGVVLVKIYEMNGNLIIKTSDNGIGMTPDQIEEAINRTQSEKHIGLANVHKRIQLYFGNTYGLSIDSLPESYTNVEIVIPKVTKDGVNLYV